MNYSIILLYAILGAFFNRIRGTGIPFHTEINYIAFGVSIGILYHLDWWGYLIMALAMLLGSATGWTEFVKGCCGKYGLSGKETPTKILSFIKINSQFTCFGWGCCRAFIWAGLIYAGFLACGVYSPFVLISIPLFYFSYRAGYLINKTGDTFEQSEPIWGAVLWGLCSIGALL